MRMLRVSQGLTSQPSPADGHGTATWSAESNHRRPEPLRVCSPHILLGLRFSGFSGGHGVFRLKHNLTVFFRNH